jgi:hypothetical protein
MTQEEIRMRALELATKHILSRGYGAVIPSEVQGKAEEILRWTDRTPATGDDLRAYVEGNPDELVGLSDSLVVRFNINRTEASHVLARVVATVLECRKARRG